MPQAHNHLRTEMHFAQNKQEQNANDSSFPTTHLALESRVWPSTNNIKMARLFKKLNKI